MPRARNGDVGIHWEVRGDGDGDPVLLIMGLGYTLEMWHRVAPALAERYLVLLFDNRGVGRSDVPPGPYTIPQMAADAVAVLDAAGIDRAHVVGASLGGVIAQELALSYPERVRSLVLACTTCGGPNAVLPEADVISLLASRATQGLEEGFRASVPFIYDAATPRERIEEDLAVRLATVVPAEGYLSQLLAAVGYDTSARLGSIRIPTLVVHGLSDLLVPPGNGELLARTIPGARLVLLRDASHIMFTDQPETVPEVLVDFLAGVPAVP